MSATIIQGDEQALLSPLKGKTVAVIGYGNQGAAHALNLRDSGVRVRVVNRPDSPNGRRSSHDGFELLPIARALEGAELVILGLPDHAHGEVYELELARRMAEGTILGVMHGYSVRFGLLKPRSGHQVVLVAPKGPGTLVRSRYVEGRGLPCMLATQREPASTRAHDVACAWAAGIGCARSGIILSSFEEETDADLFGEQTVLCGGLTALMLAAFETLVEAGISPEAAYIETCHEVKQIADLVYERGLAGMIDAISPTAAFGTFDAGPRLVDSAMRERLRAILADIRSGAFAQRLAQDVERGSAWRRECAAKLAVHPASAVSRTIRAMTAHTPPPPSSPERAR